MQIFFILMLFPVCIFAQEYSLHGKIIDEKGNGISYSTVALLQKTDSTLAFFSVTNSLGEYLIKNISSGNYILQISFLGYKTYYRGFPVPNVDLQHDFNVALEPVTIMLNDAQVDGERIPIMFHGDTIEYNAISYKTQPDAVVEDLLKKLPGIIVDRNGNIKAQGEDVKKVTVDGKEFFGNDPKIATKNLPADAIKKIQVYDSKSDEAKLTGIEDGKREKTIDLKLKDDRKDAWFGEVNAGAGSKEHYQSSAKIYKFTPEKQIAGLGMLNNINKFGFSFSDYMDFNGGLNGGGESMTISSGQNDFPIDLGENQNGLITSGATGLNYSYEKIKDRRFHASYLANGIDKDLEQEITKSNFIGQEKIIESSDNNSTEKNRAHRLDVGWKNRIDSMQLMNISVNGFLNNGDISNITSIGNYSENVLLSDQQNSGLLNRKYFSSDADANYLKKFNSNWKLLSLDVQSKWNHSINNRNMISKTGFDDAQADSTLNQEQKDNNELISIDMKGNLTRKTGMYTYVDGIISAGGESETLWDKILLNPVYEGGIPAGTLEKRNNYSEFKLRFRKIKDKTQTNIGVAARSNFQTNLFNNGDEKKSNGLYVLPSLSWEKEYRTARRLLFYYNSFLQNPTSYQLFPYPVYFDPLNISKGNRLLRPEQHHDVRIHWSIFDQFSFTSIFAMMRFGYVHDKISWERTTDENFVQTTSLINVPDDYESGVSGEFSTPIRKAGVTIDLTIDEKYEKTITYINGTINNNNVLNHNIGLTIENRKKNKWDVSVGININFVNSKYSSNEIPNQHYSWTDVFADLNFNPNETWHLSLKTDISKYYGATFGDKINVPLLRAEISYSFLKNKRGALILDAFDILNRNTGIERISEYNYLQENKSNTIQRYVMISFKYRLNRFAGKEKVDLKVR